WIYELKNPLSAVLLLIAAAAYFRFDSGGERDPRAYGIALATFVLALLAKSATVVLPPLIVLVRVGLGRRWTRRDVFALGPFFVLAAASAGLTVGYEKIHGFVGGSDWPRGFAQRAAIAGHAFWFYASRLLLPVRLSFAYSRLDVESATAWPFVFAAA